VDAEGDGGGSPPFNDVWEWELTRALVIEEGMGWEGNDMERGEGEAGVNGPEEIERIRECEPP
jgi:hypothetical protein